MHPDPQTISYIVTAIVVALVLALRFRGLRRARRLKLETLWIVPALYAIVAAAILWQFPPHGAQILWLIAALGVGAAVGWRRGALMRITIDPETHALNQHASPAALLFIVLLIVARQGLRYEAPTLGFDIGMLTDLLVMFTFGLFSATRAEMFLRARRLLFAARAN